MTTARCKIVDLNVTRYYHCISRCVRGAFLCGDGYEHRKKWLEKRIEFLAGPFALSVAGFVIMDNHFHVLLRVDPDRARKWSANEVIRRWITIYTPKGVDLKDPKSVQTWIDQNPQSDKKIAEYRERLADIGWFMKCLKEPLSRMANKEEKRRGTFWEGRFKSIPVLDEEAILATCTYIDLNPVAAGIAATPETSLHTSVRQRVNHFREQGKLESLKAASQGSIAASHAIGNAEQDHWLIPFEDRRPHTNSKPTSDREGILEKFTLGNYLLLIDYAGRIVRTGKASMDPDVKQIFDRLNTSIEFWIDQVKKRMAAEILRCTPFSASMKP